MPIFLGGLLVMGARYPNSMLNRKLTVQCMQLACFTVVLECLSGGCVKIVGRGGRRRSHVEQQLRSFVSK